MTTKMTTQEFITFTFENIELHKNNQGVFKKKPIGMPNWRNITAENYKKYNRIHHKGFAVLTGKLSNITVLDFDNPESYKITLDLCPELKDSYIVKTNKGYHIYFEYDPTILTTTNAFIGCEGVDIRNDDAIVFAPPTKYMNYDGTEVKYIAKPGEFLPVPDILKTKLKQFETNTAPKQHKQKLNVKTASNMQNIAMEITEGIADFEQIKEHGENIDIKYLDNYSDWLPLIWSGKAHDIRLKEFMRGLSKNHHIIIPMRNSTNIGMIIMLVIVI